MIFREARLKGVHVIELERIEDERGNFARTWCAREFAENGIAVDPVQCNTSFNRRRGTLRGMHFQAEPHGEAKLVRCTRGRLLDAIVDVRPESPTFGEWWGTELSAENGRMVFIPEGLAHGFQTLEDNTEVLYQIATEFRSDEARGVRWDDPEVGIDWPIAPPTVISARDWKLPTLREAMARIDDSTREHA